MKRACVTLGFLLVAACNNASGVGAPCTIVDDCDRGLVCNTAGPGGFCTRGCTFDGNQTECPTGSICASLGGSSLVCAPICTAKNDCRDQYECAATANGTVKACRTVKL